MAKDDFPAEADIDAVLEEFRGDVRECIRALLHDLAVLAEDQQHSSSFGYMRGRFHVLRLRR